MVSLVIGKAPLRFDLYMPSEEASAGWAKLLTVRKLNKETLEGEADLSDTVFIQHAGGPGAGLEEERGPSPEGQGLGPAGGEEWGGE